VEYSGARFGVSEKPFQVSIHRESGSLTGISMMNSQKAEFISFKLQVLSFKDRKESFIPNT
jgi:hypothetical protein